jgi:hypothetical protein
MEDLGNVVVEEAVRAGDSGETTVPDVTETFTREADPNASVRSRMEGPDR